jgi:regulator of replication initiation timing
MRDENMKKFQKEVKQLSSTIHHLTTENVLLKLRCEGLEIALLDEKKKEQR